MAEVYARRWDIEMALKLVKQHLKLRLLWSAKQVVILQQIWATLIISQVLQALRLEIAHKAGVDTFEVSIGLLVQYAPQYAYEGRDPVKIFVERGRELGFIRPSRRTRIHAPSIPDEAILPAPPALGRSLAPLDTLTANVTDASKHLKSELVGADALVVARSRHQPVFIPLCGLRKATVIPADSLPRPPIRGDLCTTVIPAEAGIQRSGDVASTALSQITLIVLPGNLQKSLIIMAGVTQPQHVTLAALRRSVSDRPPKDLANKPQSSLALERFAHKTHSI